MENPEADSQVGANSSTGSFHTALTPNILEYVVLFFVYSLCIVNEGSARTVQNSASREGGFPQELLLAAGIAELVFGTFGVILAVYSIYTRSISNLLYKGFIFLQMLLSYFVFTVYVIAFPAYNAANLKSPDPGLSLDQTKFNMVMGILGSMAFCGSLQGGQWLFAHLAHSEYMLQNEENQESDPVVVTARVAKTRTLLWSLVLLLVAASTLAVGANLLANSSFSTPYPVPYMYPPNVVFNPELAVATGVVMIVYVILHIIVSQTTQPQGGNNLYKVVLFLWPVVYILMGAYYSWIFGQQGFAITTGAILHSSLLLLTLFLPTYFCSRYVNLSAHSKEN